jgi:hypothetical protein
MLAPVATAREAILLRQAKLSPCPENLGGSRSSRTDEVRQSPHETGWPTGLQCWLQGIRVHSLPPRRMYLSIVMWAWVAAVLPVRTSVSRYLRQIFFYNKEEAVGFPFKLLDTNRIPPVTLAG